MDPKAFYAARAIPDGAEGTSLEEALHKQNAAYASAWAMVHALRNESPGGASRLQLWLEKMAAGEPAGAAFDAAFTGVSAADLELLRRSFTESCAARKVTLLTTEYSAAEESPGEVREMRPAEVDALWGWALVWRGRESDRPEVRKRALAAVEAEPTLADAHLLKAAYHEIKYDDAGELAEVRLAVEAAPDDELAAKALFAIQASSSRDGARDEVEKILAKWLPRAKTASLLNGFAWYMTLHGNAEKAVPIARRSAEIDPSCHECFDTVALGLLRTGRYDTALEVEQIAAGIAGERPDAKLYFELIELYRAVSTQVVLWKKRPEAGSDPSLLPPALVRAIAAAQSGGARGCRSLAKESSSSGVVVVRAEVGKDGKVTSATEVPAADWDSLAEKPAHPVLKDEAVRKCVVEQVQSARFPESGAPTRFTFPYTVQLTSGW
jgi:tetratricopeptide (TPR) repeat protein